MAAPDLADDDVLDELPPLGTALDGEEETGTGEDLEVKLSTLDAEENIGLDDAVAGMDFDPVSLLDLGDEGDRWTADSELAGDSIGADDLESAEAGEEYGWTEDTEAGPLEDWADDIDLGASEKVLGDDMGELGVEEDVKLVGTGDDDDVDLPPLSDSPDLADDDGMETLSDDLDLADDALIEGDELSYEEEARLSGNILPPALDAARVTVAHLGPPAAMIYDLCPAGDGFVAVGADSLYRVRGDEVVPTEAALGELRPTSVAVGDDAGERIAIGTGLSGVLVSEDGGRTFTPQNGWRHDRRDPEVAFYVTSERHAGGHRLWGRTRSGALFRSEDFGRTWSSPLLLAPVAALANDAEGGLLALSVPASGPAQTARTDDGGHGWTMRTVTGLYRSTDSEAEYHIAARGPHVVVASDGSPHGPHVSTDDGQSWAEVADLPAPGAAALVKEAGAWCLYASLFFAGADRGVVVRHVTRADGTVEDRLVLDVRSERQARDMDSPGDAEGDNRVFAIDAKGETGYTILTVATGAGIFVVRIAHA